jgi:glutathione S-transferase
MSSELSKKELQLAVLEHFRGFQLPSGLEHLRKWWEAVANRDSVRSIAKSQDFYLERYARFAQLRNA